MKKKLGALGVMLTAAGLLFQPAKAAADDFGRRAQPRVEQRYDAHRVTQYRQAVVHRDDRDHDRRYVAARHDGDRVPRSDFRR